MKMDTDTPSDSNLSSNEVLVHKQKSNKIHKNAKDDSTNPKMYYVILRDRSKINPNSRLSNLKTDRKNKTDGTCRVNKGEIESKDSSVAEGDVSRVSRSAEDAGRDNIVENDRTNLNKFYLKNHNKIKIVKSDWRKNVNFRRKRGLPVGKDVEPGPPFVVFSQNNGAPLSCYTLSSACGKSGVTEETLNSLVLPSEKLSNSQCESIVVSKGNNSVEVTPGVVSKRPQIDSQLKASVIANKILSQRQVVGSTSVLKQTPIAPSPSSHMNADSQGSLVQAFRSLEDKINSLKNELKESQTKLELEKRNKWLITKLQERLKLKRKQIKTLCTQKNRLTRRLELSKEELVHTRRALELVESQAIVWNDSFMTDLGRLVFDLHRVRNKKSESKNSFKTPPEVKGFVISLYLTSPKAYQLVRDCFNCLPHPKTVYKWLHGERAEEQSANDVSTEIISREPENMSLENTSLVLGEEEQQNLETNIDIPQQTSEDITQQMPQQILHEIPQQMLEPTINQQVPVSGVPAVYFVLDETGNVTGQISTTANLLFQPQNIIVSSNQVGTE